MVIIIAAPPKAKTKETDFYDGCQGKVDLDV